jgi:hypothetical protein
MATLGTVVTLLDHAKRMDPNGTIAGIGEVLTQTNEILLDAHWREGNLPTGNRTTVRTGLPEGYWRMANQGIPPSKSTTAQVDDHVGHLEQRGQIDVLVARLNGNTAAFRLSENLPHMESMNQIISETIWYGNTSVDPEKFMGFSPRFSSLTSTVPNSDNIINAGGTGNDNTSVWLICWGDESAFMMFPKGAQAGLQHRDLGEGDAFDTQTPPARFRAFMDLYEWDAGLVVKDWRYVVRIANIDVSNLISGVTAANLIENMVIALNKLPSMNVGRCAFYMNRTLRSMLDIQAMNKSNVYLTVGEEEGRPKTMLRGVPIRISDQLLENESAVT